MKDLRSLLVGAYRLSRTVTGGRAMAGSALFSSRPDGFLHHLEEGTVALSGSTFPLAFSRSYLYAIGEHAFRIVFDGRPPRTFPDIVLRDDVPCCSPQFLPR